MAAIQSGGSLEPIYARAPEPFLICVKGNRSGRASARRRKQYVRALAQKGAEAQSTTEASIAQYFGITLDQSVMFATLESAPSGAARMVAMRGVADALHRAQQSSQMQTAIGKASVVRH
jgi:hypothetical protein